MAFESSTDREQPPRAKRSANWRRVLTFTALLLSVGMVVVVASGVVLWTRLDRVEIETPGSPPGGQTILFVGSDSREGLTGKDLSSFGSEQDSPGEHADAILVVRIPDHGRARALSIPRDVVVIGPERVPTRLGLTLDYGPSALVDVLCASIGIGIDHMVVVRFASFRDIVNELGGVRVTVRHPVRDSFLNLKLPAGEVQLDGAHALRYARARHLSELVHGKWVPEAADARGRAGRAEQVLAAIGDSMPGLTSPFSLFGAAWTIAGHVSIDRAAGPFELLQIGTALRALPQARRFTLPADLEDGPVPRAMLRHGATRVVHEFVGHRDRRCSTRAASLADLQS